MQRGWVTFSKIILFFFPCSFLLIPDIEMNLVKIVVMAVTIETERLTFFFLLLLQLTETK